MVAQHFDPQASSTSALDATLTLNHSQEALEARVTALGWRGLILDADGGVPSGAHAWLDVPLPTGRRIRPLVQLEARGQGGATARFVHLFPRDRQALEAYHASRTLPY